MNDAEKREAVRRLIVQRVQEEQRAIARYAMQDYVENFMFSPDRPDVAEWNGPFFEPEV